MLTEEKKYFLKGGDTSQPFIQTKMINPALVVVATSNMAQPGDVEITEGQYDQYVASIEQGSSAAFVSAVQAFEANKQAQKATAAPKLIAVGLTQAEIDVMFS